MRSGRRLVVVVAYEGTQLLDVAGPADVFDAASRALDGQDKPVLRGDFVLPDPSHVATLGYRIVVATPTGRCVRMSNGLRVGADATLRDVDPRAVDALIVTGSPFVDQSLADRALVEGIARIADGARRVCSVCSGAFLLAAAGLLDGRRATTHWAACQELARRFPAITVEPDRIFVRDGPIATSAGVTAGIDLSLALVEEDLGPEVAVKVAHWLVVFLQRGGGQSQFSERLALPASLEPPIREIVDAIAAEPAADHRVPELADRAAMSERHFARVFARATGTTPGRFVERLRVEAARAELERSTAPIETIAQRAGFGTSETMRRAFTRVLGVAPSAYRERFLSHAARAGRLDREQLTVREGPSA